MADYRVEFTCVVVAERVENFADTDADLAAQVAIERAVFALRAVGLSLKFPEVTEIDRLGKEGEEK